MFGAKDEREVITKTQIAKKLQKGLRADIISMTVVWALVIVVFVCMYVCILRLVTLYRGRSL